jgi:hypothetical protein
MAVLAKKKKTIELEGKKQYLHMMWSCYVENPKEGLVLLFVLIDFQPLFSQFILSRS